MTDTPDTSAAFSHLLGPEALSGSAARRETLVPGPQAEAKIAKALELEGLRKLKFETTLTPEGRSDWRLTGRLRATVVQPCVVTLAPVKTVIDEPIERLFRADPAPLPEPGSEVEMPEDVDEEPFEGSIDLGQVMVEALALALPLYPRAEGAELPAMQFAEPGVTPMTDEDARPFAGLAGLRDKLAGAKGDDDGES